MLKFEACSHIRNLSVTIQFSVVSVNIFCAGETLLVRLHVHLKQLSKVCEIHPTHELKAVTHVYFVKIPSLYLHTFETS